MGAQVRPDSGASHTQATAPRAACLFGPTLQGEEAPLPSSAQHLQMSLEPEFAPPQLEKWPPLVTLGFVVAFCGAFWALAAILLLRAI